jgi:hypothetical protein
MVKEFVIMTDHELYIQFLSDIIDGEIDLDDEYYEDYDTRR